ncbi:MAG: hypothetical protein WC322_00040 [Candidatus Paceibacterota bacterium]
MLTSLFEKAKNVNADQRGDTISYILRAMVARSKDGVINIAPGIAKRILDELNFPGQRKVSESRVYGHRYAIIKGDWLEGHAITFAELPDGRVLLVDGQHRLTAISQSEASVPVTVRIVPVENIKEAQQFYTGFDQKNSVRTDKQILDAVEASRETGLTTRMTIALYAATPLLLNDLEPVSGYGMKNKNLSLFMQHNRLAALHEWAKEARAYSVLIKPATKELASGLRLPGVMAVGLYTLRHQPAKAQEFWTGMANQDGLRKNDPRATLYRDILTRSLNMGSIRQRVQMPALAWNAWCEGRDLKIIKCIEGASLALWGTPLAKGRAA